MSNSLIEKNDKKYLPIIGVLSVAIPVVVALLLFMPQTGKLGDLDVSFLPHLNAVLNTATALCLIGGVIAIKKKEEQVHRTFMMAAVGLSTIFLVSYVIFHFQGAQTYFGDADGSGVVEAAELEAVGMMRTIYLSILLPHILLAIVVVPLVLLSIYFAFSQQLERHRKIVKWTFPIWLYVAVSGVAVYLMISPYYQ